MSVLPVSFFREILYHNVGEYVGCWKVCGFNGVSFACIVDEVGADTDVLGVLIRLWDLCKLDCTLVINKDLLELSSLRVVV